MNGCSHKKEAGGGDMNKMLKKLAAVAVVAMVVLGSTAAMAATHQNPYASKDNDAKFGLIDVLMQILGISTKCPVQTDTKGSAPAGRTVVTPVTGGGATFTTDGAIWGGGRCPGCP